MKLYFLKLDGKYITKTSRLSTNNIKLGLTFELDNARFWENVSTAKSLNTLLNNRGYNTYIVAAEVVVGNIFGEQI